MYMERFEVIYREYVKLVHNFFYYKGVELSEVEDLVQEVFMRLYKNYLDRLGDLDEVETKRLLYTIAKNVWREWVRSSIKHQTYSFDDSFDQAETFEEATEVDPEERVVLLAAIDQLPESQQAVLRCRFIEGLTRRETAERLGIAETHVHTYQKRAIHTLRKVVGRPPVPPTSYT